MAVLLILGLSCGGGGDSGGGGGNTTGSTYPLFGTWVMTAIKNCSGTIGETVTFNKNGTGVYAGSMGATLTFTWSVDNDVYRQWLDGFPKEWVGIAAIIWTNANKMILQYSTGKQCRETYLR